MFPVLLAEVEVVREDVSGCQYITASGKWEAKGLCEIQVAGDILGTTPAVIIPQSEYERLKEAEGAREGIDHLFALLREGSFRAIRSEGELAEVEGANGGLWTHCESEYLFVWTGQACILTVFDRNMQRVAWRNLSEHITSMGVPSKIIWENIWEMNADLAREEAEA